MLIRRWAAMSAGRRAFSMGLVQRPRATADCPPMAAADVAAKYGAIPAGGVATPWADRANDSNALVAGVNTATVVGVVSNVRSGLRYGQPCVEFSLVTAGRARSGNAERRELVEKQVFLVAAQGPAAAAASRGLRDGDVAHVVGRASFRPIWDATRLEYDYTHEVVVQQHMGSVAAVLSETLRPLRPAPKGKRE